MPLISKNYWNDIQCFSVVTQIFGQVIRGLVQIIDISTVPEMISQLKGPDCRSFCAPISINIYLSINYVRNLNVVYERI